MYGEDYTRLEVRVEIAEVKSLEVGAGFHFCNPTFTYAVHNRDAVPSRGRTLL